MADLGLLAGLASGLQEGVKSYQTERRYQDEKAKEEAERQALKRRLAADLMSKGMRETADGYEFTPEEQERQSLERQKLQADVLKSRAAAKYGGIDPMDYDIKQERLAGLMRQREQEDRQLKQEEAEFQTPYGRALTKQDAKDLKSAGEMKENFDRKLSELISLRKKHGGELLDREAVARAKLLSNDLLLLYKDISKLGVLSQADEKILNAIIPKDPLQFSAAGLIGQDPIMKQLESFKGDVSKDFETRLRGRLAEPDKAGFLGSDGPPGGTFPRTVRKGTQTATVSNAEELREAMSEGFQ